MRKQKGTPALEASPPAMAGRAISATSFLELVDIPKQIESFVARNLKNKFMMEADIRIEMEVDPSKFRRAADLARFDDNKIKYKDKWYWSTKENINAARKRMHMAEE